MECNENYDGKHRHGSQYDKVPCGSEETFHTTKLVKNNRTPKPYGFNPFFMAGGPKNAKL